MDDKRQRIPTLPDLPEEVKQAYKDKKLIIFIGAGISRLMGCVGWDQMADELVDAVYDYALAEQIKNSKLDSKAKITIAKKYAKKNKKEKDC